MCMEKFQGIKIGSNNFKIKQYADDTQFFSHFTEESFKEIIIFFQTFQVYRVLKLISTKLKSSELDQ